MSAGGRNCVELDWRVLESSVSSRAARFIVNGLAATAVNYAVLVVLIEWLEVPYAGPAALVAALVGIAVSFTGNRLFVFRSGGPLLPELLRFKALYAAVALFQGAFLAIWTDLLSFDYRLGFIVVTVLGASISYLGSRSLVFRK
jgi:putative flippase GtrA